MRHSPAFEATCGKSRAGPLTFTLNGCFLAFTCYSLEIFDRFFLADLLLMISFFTPPDSQIKLQN
jgi:hypothetical protein